MQIANNIQTAKTILKKYFGHDNFREGQDKLILSLTQGRDVLGIMPTGGGKSICYQIPALMSDGITIVVSPLISLMKDQVSSLVQAGIRGAFYNSSLTEGQSRKVLYNMAQGMYKIIYVAPERLESESFVSVCRKLNITYVAVDEAHCVSQWGQDFRPSYLKIPEFIKKLSSRPVIGAFTATATDEVRMDIIKILDLKDPFIITTGFDRPNLYFEVRRLKRKRDKFDELVGILADHKEESGIVYCSTRKTVDAVYENLCEIGFNVARYHAGMELEERKVSQDDFIFDRKPVIIATNAFGMGIDKSNVSFVVHYNMPKNIENYYQEAGRAGRDGSDAECIMLYNPSDIFTIKYFIENQEPNDEITSLMREKIKAKEFYRMNKMIEYCNTSDCLRNYILNYFGETSSKRCGNCSECNESLNFRTLSRLPLLKNQNTDYKRTKTIDRSSLIEKSYSDIDRDLFEKLRMMRLKISKVQGVPPYVVFSDNTLKDICVKKPTTKRELLMVSGIGQMKADKYGNAVIKEIKEYMASGSSSSESAKKDMVIKDYTCGMRSAEIAKKYGLSVGTVEYIIKHNK